MSSNFLIEFSIVDQIYRYLEQNLTPEWRRAYIDYKGCKKRIRISEDRLKSKGSPGTAAAAIERQRTIERDERDSSGDDADNGPAARPKGSSRSTPRMKGSQTVSLTSWSKEIRLIR